MSRNEAMITKTDTPPPEPPAKVRTAIRQLQAVYQAGQTILERCPPGRWKLINREAARRRIHPETARTMRRFASRYTPGQVDELCRLCERHGRIIGLTHVNKFAIVTPLPARRKFQARAIAEAWSLAQVEVELRRLRGKTRGTGRKPRMPSSVDEACVWLESMGDRWARWIDHLEAHEAIRLADLPPGIRRDLQAIRPLLDRLLGKVGRRLR